MSIEDSMQEGREKAERSIANLKKNGASHKDALIELQAYTARQAKFLNVTGNSFLGMLHDIGHLQGYAEVVDELRWNVW